MRWISVYLALVLSVVIVSSYVPTAKSQETKALLLFGGEDHKTFLGCLNCIDTSPSSVCNEFGTYGSPFQSDSIWNAFGTFGNEFNSSSPWNSFSNDAPIIVDKDGRSYGYFSVNAFHRDRTRIGWIVKVLDYYAKDSDLDKTRDYMCDKN